MRIQTIQPEQFAAVMGEVGYVRWGIPIDDVREYDAFTALENIQSRYLDNNCCFETAVKKENIL